MLVALTGCKPPGKQLEGNDLSVLMKDRETDGDDTTVTAFAYKNYEVRSNQYRFIVYRHITEELFDHTKE